MNDTKYITIYQSLFQTYNMLDDSDERERRIAYMIFDILNRMEEYWGGNKE